MNKIYNFDTSRAESTGQVVNGTLSSAIALALSSKNDIVQLDPSLADEFAFIKAHYDAIGLEYAQNVIWDLSCEVLREFPEYTPDYFMFDRDVHRVRSDESWLKIVALMDNKNSLVGLKEKLDLQMPATIAYASSRDFIEPKGFSMPYILKKSLSTGGIDVFLCDHHSQCREYISSFTEDEPFQVQEFIHTDTFYNLVYEINEEKLVRLGASQQILKGVNHYGNVSLIDESSWNCVEPLAKWMHAEGMRGTFGFDVAVIQEGDMTHYKLIECNPRYNASTFGHKIAAKLGVSQWRMESMKTKKRSLRHINLDGIRFDSSKKSGVVIVNWGKISHRRLSFLIAGTPQEQVELKAELLKRLKRRFLFW